MRSVTWRRLFLPAVGLSMASCAPVSRALPPQSGATEATAAKAEPPSEPLVPLSAAGLELQQELTRELKALCEPGPRSLAHSWQLHGATDHIARSLEKVGYEVNRQGFEVGEELLQNLEVVLLPEPLDDPVAQAQAMLSQRSLVVAAVYDSAAESPGADASASGAAALLVLARALRNSTLQRAVRLVWLSNESGSQGTRGSEIYVEALKRQEIQVSAAIVLGGLGHYSVEADTQRYPEQLLYGATGRTRRADFVGVLYNARSNAFYEQLSGQWSAAQLPVQGLVLPESSPLANQGPQATFWEAGWVGLALTDTASFRSPHYNTPEDTVERLDLDRYTRTVAMLLGAVSRLTME